MSLFDWISHKLLVRKGLACEKTRRQMVHSDWRSLLERRGVVKAFIFSVFAAGLFGFLYWHEGASNLQIDLLAAAVFLCALGLLRMGLPSIWKSNSKLVLVLSCVSLNLAVLQALFVFWPQEWLLPKEAIFLVPNALAPMLLMVLLGPQAGLFGVLMLSLMGALLHGQNFSLLMISLVTGFTAVAFSRGVRKRSDLIKAGAAVGIANGTCALAFGWVTGMGSTVLLLEALGGIGVGILTALLVNAVLPIFEWAFEITTDISWVEAADLNHPLLQEMTIEAPGTYHHSLMVANLAEAAATAIGANATQCRVMAYFHDIGKIIKPEYFTENIPQGSNPHENLSPAMSALIIISHVKEGVDLALKHGLKKAILDGIQQHHGTSVVYYFYRRAKQMEDDAREGGKILSMRPDDVPSVDENTFRYPGPKPQMREIGILMLADAIEATSRSIERPTPQKVESMVNDIITRKIAAGQLDASGLTLNEIQTVRETFIFTVKNMLHSRITYPKDKDEKTASASTHQSAKKSLPSAALS